MSITLSDGTTTVILPPDLQWVDEHAWQPVTSSYARTLTGAAVIESQARIAGRPITLQSPSDEVWWTRDGFSSLKSWLDAPDQQLTLTILGNSYTVRFRHHEPPAAEAKPVIFYGDPVGADYIIPLLKFMTV